MWMNSLLASVAVVVLAPYAIAHYNIAEFCQLVPVGTKLPSLTSCQTFYTCLNSRQVFAAKCFGTNIFDKDYQECVPVSVGNCAINGGNPCANKDKVWVSDPNSCGVWHYCSNGAILGSGMCPSKEVFNAARQLCEYGQCNTMTDNGIPLIENVCSIMQNEKFFGDFDNCHAWHRCNGMTLESGICEDGTTYDSSQRTCVYTNGNTCSGSVTATCNAAMNGNLTADTNICSVYYKCVGQNNHWSWQRIECPTGDYYDVNLKDCQSRQAATPIATCDRCEFATTTWVNAVDSNCTKYLTCRNGREIASGYCNHPNSYFNEEEQACVEGGDSLSNYRIYNGACDLPPSMPSSNGTSTSASRSTTSGSNSTTTGNSSTGSGSTTTESDSTATGSSAASGNGSTATESGSTANKSGTIAKGSGTTSTASGSTTKTVTSN